MRIVLFVLGILVAGLLFFNVVLLKGRAEATSDRPYWVTVPYQGHNFAVFEVERLGYPEHAIVRAPDQASREVLEDSVNLREFINSNDVFSAPVRPFANAAVTIKAVNACAAGTTDFILIHGKASNVLRIEVPCYE